jgi:hypothetical protein
MEERFSIRSYIYSSTQDTKYLLVIETSPGDAKFEATVHYVSDSDVEISGDISRINRYGDQSKCIDEKTLDLTIDALTTDFKTNTEHLSEYRSRSLFNFDTNAFAMI